MAEETDTAADMEQLASLFDEALKPIHQQLVEISNNLRELDDQVCGSIPKPSGSSNCPPDYVRRGRMVRGHSVSGWVYR